MLTNIEHVSNLRGLARAKARLYETKTVHSQALEAALEEGWSVDKRNRKSVRLKREKDSSVWFLDRVWSILFKMEFSHLSLEGGALLENRQGGAELIDIACVGEEVAVGILCRTSRTYSRLPTLRADLSLLDNAREKFARSVNSQFDPTEKRQVALVILTQNALISDQDRELAKEKGVTIFDGNDLSYYESLVSHLGPAARYQFLADLLPGKSIAGLAIRVPAIRTKMGGTTCYTFSISPEYLLKIAYVSHRSKGKASDVHTYQRMLSKARLNKIRSYISAEGVFPTNIVINMENRRLRFEKIQQEDQENGVMGWLDIKPAYKSAWVIDGQHRLFSYSGHEKAAKSRLAVLAFEGLAPSKQAGLFIDINAKQKSVRQSLLQELYAELHWDAEEPAVRVRAIISKAVQVLDAEPRSPLHQRIQTADAAKDAKRCISLTSLFSALERTEFYIEREKGGQVLQYGPLWASDNDSTLRRTVFILESWFRVISQKVPDWWDKGAAEGGGLAMNDGVTTCINVLRSVFEHFRETGRELTVLDDDKLFQMISVYGSALGDYFAGFSEDSRKSFRDLRGNQGQTKRTRQCQQYLREYFSEFNPQGLDEFLKVEKAQTNSKAKTIVDRIETSLQGVVIEELKRECGPEEGGWWHVGVPKKVRLKAVQRFEEEDGKRGAKENYFDLIDYRDIIHENWRIFEVLLGHGRTGSKEKRTSWIANVNEVRKLVAHPSASTVVSLEELSRLEDIDRWLESQLSEREPIDSPEDESAS
jgi:DNA sulfur modification protein DndB